MKRIFCVLGLSVLVATPGWGGGSVVTIQTAEASCSDDSGNRFVDCGNGTVTDTATGLVWLANASCFGPLEWHLAMEVVAGLSQGFNNCGLDDDSSPGEWHVPSILEWREMTDVAFAMACSPQITNDAGTDCWSQECVDAGDCSFYEVQDRYWSSTSDFEDVDSAWTAGLDDNVDNPYSKANAFGFWPVRRTRTVVFRR